MSAVSLVNDMSLNCYTDYSVTVFRWMKDGGLRRGQLTNGNLKRNLRVEQKDEYEAKCTSTIEACVQRQTRFIYLPYFLLIYVWWILRIIPGFCFQIEKRWHTEGNSEDGSSEGDPEENTACVQALTRNWKDKYERKLYKLTATIGKHDSKIAIDICFQCISFISCFQIIFSLSFYLIFR